MSPYIHNCDGLCTRTDHHMLLPIVLRIFMVSIFSSHILISDYQFSYHSQMISLLSKLTLFHLLSS